VEERTHEVSETAERLLREAGERKRAESTLKDLNTRLHTLIQSMPDVVFFKDTQFRYLVVNKAFEEFTGARQEELLGKTDGELLPPDLADFCKKSDEEVVRRRTPLHFEEQTITREGERRYFDTVKSPLYDHNGNLIGVVGVSRDMTERKRAERLIRESQERYMNLVELATDIIYISDNNGKQVFMNDAAFKILEYSPEEVIGQPFINLIHPDDREKTFKKRKEMSERGIDVFNFENRYRTKSGRAINVLHNVRVLRNEKGEFVGTQGIARDITKRKRAEEKLKLYSRALEEAMDGIQIVDLDGHIVYSNKSVEEIYGFSADELIGKHVNEMNVDKEFASKVILPGIRMAGRWDGELMVVHKSGRQFPIWLSTSLVKNAGGEPIAMVGIIRDITERRKAAEEREKMIAELQDALANIKTLKGLLPICASCKKIRDDKGYWNQIEAYIRDHTDADFSHGICPECREKLYPDL
jgi:PAS domain S-box-containing protein